jgi:RNA polymerase sigma-70 factor (ECF subfamily)
MPDIKNISDEQLVVKVRKEDKELYAEIVNRYQDKLMRYATYLINNEEKAADVVQEGLIKAYVNLNGFNTKKKFSSWIYRIVHNEAMNAVKKYHKESPLVDNMDLQSGVDLEEEFDKKQVKEMAQDCLKNMPIKYSEPLELYFIEDYSYEDISDILRLPMGTVATRINRAKALMKKICQTSK